MGHHEVQVRLRSGHSFTVPFPDKELWAGRASACDIHIDDLYLSRRHLVLYKEDGEVLVKDMSRNGTLVNGTRIDSPQPIRPCDVVELFSHPDFAPTASTAGKW